MRMSNPSASLGLAALRKVSARELSLEVFFGLIKSAGVEYSVLLLI